MNYWYGYFEAWKQRLKSLEHRPNTKNGNSHFGYQLFPPCEFPFEIKMMMMMMMKMTEMEGKKDAYCKPTNLVLVTPSPVAQAGPFPSCQTSGQWRT